LRQSPTNCTARYLHNCTGPARVAEIILWFMILNSRVLLSVGPYAFAGTLERKTAPVSTAWLLKQFPLTGVLQHACWSGEAAWLPLTGAPQLVAENPTTRPRPGQILLYTGITSQAELLLPYGTCAFASKAGALAGSPVITLDDSHDDLRALGALLISSGMQALTLKSSTLKESK
jgi:hypothetical protein